LQATLGGAYRFERELGGGGMARVYLAEERTLGRHVVINVPAAELTEGVSADRFAREVRVAARLQHPNIVPVLSTGSLGDVPYYTMPYIDGASLRERIVRGPLTLPEAISMLRDVARALAHAHAHGVVHRDIKPENILLTGGVAVVTDFGIAKAISAARVGVDRPVPAFSIEALTQFGTAIGTPAYMAPEQAASDPDIDHRADLYAWGLIAWESLIGRHPFAEKRTPMQLVTAQLTEVPAALGTLRGDVSASLAAWLEGNFDAALPWAERCVELAPDSTIWRWRLGYARVLAGRLAEARADAEWLLHNEPSHPYTAQFLALVRVHDGDSDGARAAWAPFAATTFDDHLTFHIAEILVALGDHDGAIALLDRVVRRGFYPYGYMAKHARLLDPLRTDARFVGVVDEARRRWEAFTP